MPPISWVLFRERVVAKNSPKYLDVTNRPLRQLLEMQGWNPDDPNFEGIHHYPIGLYTDDITEEHAGHGVHIHNPVVIDGSLHADGDFTVLSGKHTITATDVFDIHLGGHDLDIDGGDMRLTNGVFYGTINFGRVSDRLEIGDHPYLTSDDPRYDHAHYAELYVGGSGRFVHDSDWSAYIKVLDLGTSQRDSLGSPFPFVPHTIAGVPWIAYIPNGVGLGADDWLQYYMTSRTTWFRDTGIDPIMSWEDTDHALWHYDNHWFATSASRYFVIPFDGIYQWDDATNGGSGIPPTSGVPTHIHKIIDYPETGWALGSGGSAKGGLNAGTATTAQVAAVVNALVSALMSHHKLLQV